MMNTTLTIGILGTGFMAGVHCRLQVTSYN